MTWNELLFPVLRLTSLGGGASGLTTVPTVGVTPPLRAIVIVGTSFYLYQLRAGTDANNSPSIIRPSDYNGTTNQKVWEKIAAFELGPLKQILTATASLNFPSIAAADQQELTIAVAGAAVGDGVNLGLPAAPTAGIIYQAFVSAADTVTVRATNITAGAIDPGAQTFRATVLQF